MASMYVPKQSSCHTCWRPFCSRVSPTPHTHGDWLQLVVTQITVSLIQLPGAFCSLWTQKISLIYYILLSTCKEGCYPQLETSISRCLLPVPVVQCTTVFASYVKRLNSVDPSSVKYCNSVFIFLAYLWLRLFSVHWLTLFIDFFRLMS